MKNDAMKTLLPLLALTLLAVAGCARSQAAANVAADDGQGAVILEASCTSCHDLGGLGAFADSYGEAQWRTLIDTMVSYGAVITPEDADTLARYLAVNYGTGVAAPVDSQAEALFQRACTTCHGVDAITLSPTTFTAETFRMTVERMRNYGAPVPADQVGMLVEYLVDTYGE
jgi:cytochrome c5